jgi:hypothetical protein
VQPSAWITARILGITLRGLPAKLTAAMSTHPERRNNKPTPVTKSAGTDQVRPGRRRKEVPRIIKCAGRVKRPCLQKARVPAQKLHIERRNQ